MHQGVEGNRPQATHDVRSSSPGGNGLVELLKEPAEAPMIAVDLHDAEGQALVPAPVLQVHEALLFPRASHPLNVWKEGLPLIWIKRRRPCGRKTRGACVQPDLVSRCPELNDSQVHELRRAATVDRRPSRLTRHG